VKFSHPLIRASSVWPAVAPDGKEQRMLVIITTLVLNPATKGYKKALVERLSAAAQEYLSSHPTEASGFILMNRARDWQSRKPKMDAPVG
jgi:hypothetical protein